MVSSTLKDFQVVYEGLCTVTFDKKSSKLDIVDLSTARDFMLLTRLVTTLSENVPTALKCTANLAAASRCIREWRPRQA